MFPLSVMELILHIIYIYGIKWPLDNIVVIIYDVNVEHV